jgi:hypothetical protein
VEFEMSVISRIAAYQGYKLIFWGIVEEEIFGLIDEA